jgi:hypothetical protein
MARKYTLSAIRGIVTAAKRFATVLFVTAILQEADSSIVPFGTPG